ncbi:sphinganine-1-phosphate aldolase [Tilletiaria anomala UBC 951]|uniref:sphinganine-1-phosphate aldolase n=1 Tax=Tilletiaria anomala (strain ATCC 24038 / CBS 436.72 / UBC 951) TaxID=1037660 RepID=A0A066WES6_TILAU|nr:sphinganine-1-phosphate aldolase [Tilletiaria anomala UBC 951]KDN49250.1 sphinganine-1-phosphate aldolase [Tilletiaria anomala UBC 951]
MTANAATSKAVSVAASAATAPKGKAQALEIGMIKLVLSQIITFENAKTFIFYLVVWRYLSRLLRHVKVFGVTKSVYQLYTALSRRILTLVLRIPAARRKVERELKQAEVDIDRKLVVRPAHISINSQLPMNGKDVEWLRTELRKLQKLEISASSGATGSKEGIASAIIADDSSWQDVDGQSVWQGGKISGAVYHGGQDLSDLLADAIRMFMVSNPLHPDVFPGVRKMEAEIVSMCLRMYNAPSDTGVGATTSGGTESILMACKAMRDWGRSVKGITEPEIVIPTSAHAAFDKAGAYFGIKIIHMPVNRISRRVQISSVARAITRNTILLVGSAPNFPDGIIDDIPALAVLAKRHNIGCHVDCCLGSFLVPFLERAGLPSEPFDFRIDGVTSISCDTHKYGFAPKGSSVIMYRSANLRRYQYYVQPDWPGGVYASPTIAGSRPGALIAGAWAAMMTMGEDGYTGSCKQIVGAARQIEKAIRDEIPQLQVLGKPLVSIVAFASAGSVNIYDVGDAMSKKGWHLNALATDPPGIHIACTRLTVPVVEDFITDLKKSVAESKTKPAKQGTMASLYGLGSSSAVGPSLVSEVAVRFIDTLYKM